MGESDPSVDICQTFDAWKVVSRRYLNKFCMKCGWKVRNHLLSFKFVGWAPQIHRQKNEELIITIQLQLVICKKLV